MVFVGAFLVISAITNSSVIVIAQQPSPKNAPEKGTVFVFNEKSRPANDPEKYAALASVVKGKAVPDYNLCDIVVYRQATPIVRNDGMIVNNLPEIGHYIEMVSEVTKDTRQFASADTAAAGQQKRQNQSNNLKVTFGEFALIDPEVVPVQQIMGKYNRTEIALHHHLLNESPKILFLHWSNW